jgi:hypothetical protein
MNHQTGADPMKTSILTLALALIFPAAASAEVLIVVDTSTPSAVTFTATEGVSAVTNSDFVTNEGIILLDFFDPGLDEPFDAYIGSGEASLRFAGAVAAYDYINAYSSRTGAPRSFAFYYDSDDEVQNFVVGERVFVGESVVDMTDVARQSFDLTDRLPSGCVRGDIVADDWGGTASPVVGQWETSSCISLSPGLKKCRIYSAKIKMNYAKCLELDNVLVAKGKAPKGICESKRTASLDKATAKFVTKLGVDAAACGIDADTADAQRDVQLLASANSQSACEAAGGTWDGSVCTPAAVPDRDCFREGICGAEGYDYGIYAGATLSSTGCSDTNAGTDSYNEGRRYKTFLPMSFRIDCLCSGPSCDESGPHARQGG